MWKQILLEEQVFDSRSVCVFFRFMIARSGFLSPTSRDVTINREPAENRFKRVKIQIG